MFLFQDINFPSLYVVKKIIKKKKKKLLYYLKKYSKILKILIQNVLKSSLSTNKKCEKKYKAFLIFRLCKFPPEIY